MPRTESGGRRGAKLPPAGKAILPEGGEPKSIQLDRAGMDWHTSSDAERIAANPEILDATAALYAQKRMGEITREMPKADPNDAKYGRSESDVPTKRNELAKLRVTKQHASDAERIAARTGIIQHYGAGRIGAVSSGGETKANKLSDLGIASKSASDAERIAAHEATNQPTKKR